MVYTLIIILHPSFSTVYYLKRPEFETIMTSTVVPKSNNRLTYLLAEVHSTRNNEEDVVVMLVSAVLSPYNRTVVITYIICCRHSQVNFILSPFSKQAGSKSVPLLNDEILSFHILEQFGSWLIVNGQCPCVELSRKQRYKDILSLQLHPQDEITQIFCLKDVWYSKTQKMLRFTFNHYAAEPFLGNCLYWPNIQCAKGYPEIGTL